MRIFYVTNGIHITGGQLVNLEHVAGLRRLGYDARFLIVRKPGEQGISVAFPPGLAAPCQTTTADLTADDIVVVGEMFGTGALAVMNTPARKVLHNQGPYYTFKAFSDLDAIRGWGCEAMILPSRFAADMVTRMGWDRPLHVVRPPLDPVFVQPPAITRELRVAAVAARRPQEMRLLRGMVRSLRPDLACVPWIEIAGASRAEVARVMAASEIFLALSCLDGLSLPPLEALSCGCLVAGFHGGGAQEYATAENGDWFDDGRHFEIAEALIALIDGVRDGRDYSARRAAGKAAAAAFSKPAFEAQLAQAWAVVAGPPRGVRPNARGRPRQGGGARAGG